MAETRSYPRFYSATIPQPTSIHPEANDITPIGNTDTTKNLENQILDISSQLQHPALVWLDVSQLVSLSDLNVVAQKFCNILFKKAFRDTGIKIKIPILHNISELETHLINHNSDRLLDGKETPLKAIILDKCTPTPEIIQICQQLSDELAIALITEEKIEPPLRGFPPHQDNLISALQTWFDESCEEN